MNCLTNVPGTAARGKLDAAEIKSRAAGRWTSILPAVAGIDAGLLDGKNHPCPKCGGRDRFTMIRIPDGALYCRKCFAEKNGDGLAAVQWLTGCSFPEAVRKVGEYLGLEGSGAPTRSSSRTSASPRSKPVPETKPKAKGKVYPTAEDAVEAALSGIVRDGGAGATVAGSWSYQDAAGAEVLRVVRVDMPDGGPGKCPKTFRPLRPTDGGWRLGDPEGTLPLYALPALQAAQGRVYVVEGERCAEAGRRIGLTVTTSAHGASSPGKSDWSPLAGRDVVIIPDRDDAGEKYAEEVKGILEGLDPPARVVIVALPGLTGHGADLADFVEARDAQESEDIRREVEAAVADAIRAAARFTTVIKLSDLPIVTPPTFHMDGVLYDGAFTIIGGDPKAGKSTVAIAIALGTLTGIPVLGRQILRTGPVALVEADMDEGRLSWVIRRVGMGLGIDLNQEMPNPVSYHCATDIDLLHAETRDALANDIAALRPVLVILDPLADLQSGNENDRHEIKPALDFCLRLRDRVQTGVLLVDHLSKPIAGGRAKGPAGYALRGSGAKYGRADSVLIVRDLEGVSELCGRHRYGPATEPFYFKVVVDETGHRLEECDEAEGGRHGRGGGDDGETPEQRILDYLRRAKSPQSVNKIATGAGVQKARVSDALLNLFGRGEIDKDEQKSFVRWFSVKSGSRSGGNQESGDTGSGNAFGNQVSDSRSGSHSGGNQSGTSLGGEVVPVVPRPFRGGNQSGNHLPTATPDGLPPWASGGATDGDYLEDEIAEDPAGSRRDE